MKSGNRLVLSEFLARWQKNCFSAGEKGTPKAHIWTVSIEGGEPKQITSCPGVDVFPSWSPDGKKIAFDVQEGLDYGLFLMEDFLPLVKKGTPVR